MKKFFILINQIDMKQSLQLPNIKLMKMVLHRQLAIAFMLLSLAFFTKVNAQVITSGDTSVCPAEVVTYVFAGCPAPNASYTFTVLGGGSIVGANTGCSVTVAWGNTAGKYIIQAVAGATTVTQSVRVEGNISLACDDLVHVSLNGNCQAIITPGIVLEGDTYDSYSYAITLYTLSGTLIPGNVVNGAYLDQKIKVHIRHICSGITCWGTILIEDKYIPSLLCDGRADTLNCGDGYSPEELLANASFTGLEFPVPSAATVVANGTQYCYRVTNFDLCCDVELCYYDTYTKYGCAGLYYARNIRDWTAKDCKGNTTTCSDTIYFRKGSIVSIVCPPSYDGVDPDGGGPLPKNPGPIACDSFKLPSQLSTTYDAVRDPYRSYYHKMANGNPSPFDYYDSFGRLRLKGTGFPRYNTCDHLAQSYRDIRINVCPGTFKVVRVWKVYDWCSGRIEECTQLIKIEDGKPPVISCERDMILPMTYYVCGGNAVIPFPTLTFDCSGVTVDAGYIVNRTTLEVIRTNVVVNQSAKTVTIPTLVTDSVWVQFYVTDSCGNGPTICRTEVVFADDLDPVAICNSNTVVSLNENGYGELKATSVDNGSFDNCTLDSMFVRRMIDNCNVTTNTTFGSSVQFCCADVANSPIMVVFRVKDKKGNFNDCMVSVTVQDKIPPTITCPANVTVNCGTDISNLTITGNATATDGCAGPTVTYRNDTLNWNCGTGVINRVWRATDVGGRFAICTQRITVRDNNPFTCAQVNWSAVGDITVNGCDVSVAHPDATGKPSYPTGTSCKNIIAGYTDERFYNEGGGICIRIVRKWKVIDWCTYDVNAPAIGVCERTQVIRIRNTGAPRLVGTTCASETFCTNAGSCISTVVDTAYANDDCTDSLALTWTYRVDVGNNNSIDLTGTGRIATADLSIGTHRINWEVRDACGNSTQCNKIITVRDCKEPTPFCKAGLITVVMPSAREITVKAKDFNEKSEDNCTIPSKLRYSFSSNLSDTTRTYRCADLPDGREGRFTLRMYVWDESNNSSFCEVTLIVQDGAQNICPNTFAGGVSGLIISNGNSPLRNANVQLVDPTTMVGSIYSEESGKFAFIDLLEGKNYDVMPFKNDDVSNGLTTADIVLIQKHILGTQSLKTPYEYIAADLNNSKTISAADISELRKVILGVTNSFKNEQKSWRFVKKDFEFADPTNPWYLGGWPEIAQINNLQGESQGNNFVAVKIGDLNYSAKTNQLVNSSSRSNDKVYFELDNVTCNANQIVKIPVYLSSKESIEGFQLGWKLSSNAEFINIESGKLQIDNANYAVKQNEGTVINMSVDGRIMPTNEVLFYITIRTYANSQVEKILSVSNQYLSAEAYNADLQSMDILLRDRVNKTVIDQYELYQNVPNPFGDYSTITYSSPIQTDVNISVKDMNGRVIWSQLLHANKGKNEVVISKANMSIQAGVYFYTIEAQGFTQTKKMIISK